VVPFELLICSPLSLLDSRSSGNHGSPDYNPPEINSAQPLPPDYDFTKKDVWAVYTSHLTPTSSAMARAEYGA